MSEEISVRFNRLRFIVVMLVLAMVPLPVLSLGVPSQAATTVTRLTTIMIPSTTTLTKIVTIQSTGSETTTYYYTTTSYLTKTSRLLSQTITPSQTITTGQQRACIYDSRSFAAKRGQVVSMSMDSSSQVSFFVMTKQAYDAWLQVKQCIVEDALVAVPSVTSYSDEFVVPDDGTYYFAFLNFSKDTVARVGFTADIVGSASESSTVVATTFVIEDYSTTTEKLLVTVTEIVTSVWTEPVGSTGTSSRTETETAIRTETSAWWQQTLSIFGLRDIPMMGVVGVPAVLVVLVLVVAVATGRRGTKRAPRVATVAPLPPFTPSSSKPPSPPPEQMLQAPPPPERVLQPPPPPVKVIQTPSPPPTPEISTKYCIHCGTVLEETAIYCHKCGGEQKTRLGR